MKWLLLTVLLALAVTAHELPLAEPCDIEACQLPNCRCSSTEIPGGLAASNVPQFVVLTFDDAVTVTNIGTYRKLLIGRTNSNNCPAGATFYVNHEYTNYQFVNELYNMGCEIALHSISHQTPVTYWKQASYEDMEKEFADQIKQMSKFANMSASEIYGVRMPFLQMAGNNCFHVMKDYGLVYDSSWPNTDIRNPGLWPYTLDYASIQDCIIPPCPTASIPGIWVFNMSPWIDLAGNTCSMVDSCVVVPDHNDEEAWFEFILTNFERHYYGNRTPFPFYIHEWYLAIHPAVLRALVRFADYINSLSDVLTVNQIEVIDWMRNPVTVEEYRLKPCKQHIQTTCASQSCGPLTADHTQMSYWMTVCGECPREYPWLGNPLGL
ncbi:hypothetical protein K1T71_012547 [Dendrolimus kikuchii]|uniref:Uncharacterized protein n=1 Tax=Dendrolimus kikuchii TaxID=765133 RepID=A0ACC1CJM4_9NEOP|nr:hypothetical protein K1T71_012547 [Dendrolimus kikuchii]